MPHDHYVSRVHLKQFCSPQLGNRMYAVRKSDLKSFTPRPKDVCKIENGSNNSYLNNERAIEYFLRTIEPHYDIALQNLTVGKLDDKTIHAVAGFAAYIMVCSPAGMRIYTELLKRITEASVKLMDKQEVFGKSPEQLGGLSLTDLLEKEIATVKVDQKYPQAIGISSIDRYTAIFGNFFWEILSNPFQQSHFFTSDFPVAIEQTNDPKILNRIVPLSPSLAVRIKPDININKDACDLNFSNFRYKVRKLGQHEVVKINKLIVKCAEENVFYRDEDAWVKKFIQKNRYYRVEPRILEIPTHRGICHISTQTIKETAPSSHD